MNKKQTSLMILLMLAAAMIFVVFPLTVSAETKADPETVEGEIIVIMKDNAEQKPEEVVGELDSQYTVDAAEILTDQTGEEGESLAVTMENPDEAEKAIEALQENPDVAIAQPNFSYGLLENAQEPLKVGPFTDSLSRQQYYLNPWDSTFRTSCGANVINAWNRLSPVSTVTIAVLDTGCNVNHEDLSANVLKGYAFNAVTGKTGASAVADSVGHGTHISGIAGAVCGNQKGISGVAGNRARILPIQVFDGSLTSTKHLLTAFDYLESLMNDGKLNDLHVINLSLGGYVTSAGYSSQDAAVASEISYLRTRDVLTVCAGGNGNEKTAPNTQTIFPGDYQDCFCVTALESDGTNLVYSDYNKAKDISAPGKSILSTYLNNRYAAGEGTSMAAPVVSGIAAMLWADNPNLTAAQAVASMQNTAHPVNTARNNRGSATGSRGAIDADAALAYASRYNTARKSISGAAVSISGIYPEYTGGAIRPAVTVTTGGAKLTLNRDYILRYENNVYPGTASVIVSGIGSWKGSRKATFTIVRPKAKGTVIRNGSSSYIVTARKVKASEVSFRRTSFQKSVTVPKTITSGHITYKVTGIAPKAFAKSKKLKTVNLKTPYLTKNGVKRAFKGSKVKTVKVKLGTKATNKKYIKKYKKYFKKKNCGRSVRVK